MTEQQIKDVGPLIGWKQIAIYLGVSEDTAQKWHKKRRIPIRRSPGGSPMIFPDELRRWVESSK